tara:strand:+ start:90 stop:245 length:156 start_codon:yes stop_codon:yes gene_type:complete
MKEELMGEKEFFDIMKKFNSKLSMKQRAIIAEKIITYASENVAKIKNKRGE